jgi:AcrR family transcriptional regulator|tara:strand:+ start:42 stop:638 length:597 start_codon:yes stop_codon:yes gene_type:complete
MIQKPKQKRSENRINKILDTAEIILNEEPLTALTIAKISTAAELKRTSTYKFFETSEDIKNALIQRYIQNCNQALIQNLETNANSDYSSCLKNCVIVIIDFFQDNPGAKKLILENTVTPPIPSKYLYVIADTMLKHIEKSLGLPSMFNKSGVFLVIAQIIFAILSLNTKENDELTDVGLNEAVRATNAYLISCIATPA